MHKIITGLLSFTFFTLCTEVCFSDQGMLHKAKKNGKNAEFVKSQIDEMQQQIDQLQKYIFNLQDVKNIPHAVTTFQTDELVEQIKMLRKEMEGVKKDIQSLKYKLEKSSRSFDSKINNIKSEIDEQSNNKQILNLIDSELDVSNNLTRAAVKK
jgi:conjugal transfer/entry exclusion protein